MSRLPWKTIVGGFENGVLGPRVSWSACLIPTPKDYCVIVPNFPLYGPILESVYERFLLDPSNFITNYDRPIDGEILSLGKVSLFGPCSFNLNHYNFIIFNQSISRNGLLLSFKSVKNDSGNCIIFLLSFSFNFL